MTSHELQKKLGLTVFHQGEDRQVSAGYCCDLLSWVMGKAPANCAWITVMNNHNVAAVAMLCDASCIILAQGAQPDANLQKRAELEDLNLYGSELDAYPLALAMGELQKGESPQEGSREG